METETPLVDEWGRKLCRKMLSHGTQRAHAFIGMVASKGAKSGTRPAHPASGRVLVVDDDPLVARSVALILSAYSVDIVNSGADALARIGDGWQYDVILCDVMMPSMTGPQMLEELFATSPTTAARVVFMTGCVLEPELQRILDRFSNPCLEKPLNIEALRALVESRIREARAPAVERVV